MHNLGIVDEFEDSPVLQNNCSLHRAHFLKEDKPGLMHWAKPFKMKSSFGFWKKQKQKFSRGKLLQISPTKLPLMGMKQLIIKFVEHMVRKFTLNEGQHQQHLESPRTWVPKYSGIKHWPKRHGMYKWEHSKKLNHSVWYYQKWLNRSEKKI